MHSLWRQEEHSRTLFQHAFGSIDVDGSKTISMEEFMSFYVQGGQLLDNVHAGVEAKEGQVEPQLNVEAKLSNRAIPKRLDLSILEERSKLIAKSGLADGEAATQMGLVGKGYHMEETEWSKQLDEVINGVHIYMDQLMPDGTDFENHDAYLPLEAMAVPSSSFAQFVRRSWSTAGVECQLIFSWDSSDRRAWQIRQSLKNRGPGRKKLNSAPAAEVDSAAVNRTTSGGPPSSFKEDKIRILIAELLQVNVGQINLYLLSPQDLHSSQQSNGKTSRTASLQNANGEGRLYKSTTSSTSGRHDPRSSVDTFEPGQSYAILNLGPSLDSLDRRTPEQLFHVLEAHVMDAILGPMLPPPLSQLVSLTVLQNPVSPFRALPTPGPPMMGAPKWKPDLPWRRQPDIPVMPAGLLFRPPLPHIEEDEVLAIEHGDGDRVGADLGSKGHESGEGAGVVDNVHTSISVRGDKQDEDPMRDEGRSAVAAPVPLYHAGPAVGEREIPPSFGPVYSSGDSYRVERKALTNQARKASRQSNKRPGPDGLTRDDEYDQSDHSYASDISERTHPEERLHRHQMQLQQMQLMQQQERASPQLFMHSASRQASQHLRPRTSMSPKSPQLVQLASEEREAEAGRDRRPHQPPRTEQIQIHDNPARADPPRHELGNLGNRQPHEGEAKQRSRRAEPSSLLNDAAGALCMLCCCGRASIDLDGLRM
jgi:hypothetical protein